jgi:hypothetical protein
VPDIKVDVSRGTFEEIAWWDRGTIVIVDGEYLDICSYGLGGFQTSIVGKSVKIYESTE